VVERLGLVAGERMQLAHDDERRPVVGRLLEDLAVLLLEQVDRAEAAVHADDVREGARVVRIAREEALVLPDDGEIERVAATRVPVVIGGGGGRSDGRHVRQRGGGQREHEQGAETPHHRRS
jgi:hypothetical protein